MEEPAPPGIWRLRAFQLLFALLLALVLTHLISQRLSRPIHLVAHAMQNFDTNRSRRFPEDRSDEIGVLYHSFNRMMSHIDILFSEVRETAGRQRQSELQALQAQINPHFLYIRSTASKALRACTITATLSTSQRR